MSEETFTAISKCQMLAWKCETFNFFCRGTRSLGTTTVGGYANMSLTHKCKQVDMSTADQLISNFRNDKAIPTYFCLQLSYRPKSFEIF